LVQHKPACSGKARDGYLFRSRQVPFKTVT